MHKTRASEAEAALQDLKGKVAEADMQYQASLAAERAARAAAEATAAHLQGQLDALEARNAQARSLQLPTVRVSLPVRARRDAAAEARKQPVAWAGSGRCR